MKVLAFVTDAFGGRGGIAKFNRDMLAAICAHPACDTVVALPRIIVDAQGSLPARLAYESSSARGKLAYLRVAARRTLTNRFDLVVCGHVNLLPAAWLAAQRNGAPMILITHGIEAWHAGASHWLSRRLCAKATRVISVSELTRSRLLEWSAVEPTRVTVLPNCIDSAAYGPGPRNVELLRRHGLEGRTILLTLARLSAAERYKGVDEVIDVLPALSREVPSIAYVVMGDGDDRARLEAKVASLGIADRVVFTGFVRKSEKADYLRLADAFVMPGHGEGFGIVYLEALACGVPVVASAADASRETVLDGAIGEVVDPTNPADIVAGTLRALRVRPRAVPPELEQYSVKRFREQWHAVLNETLSA